MKKIRKKVASNIEEIEYSMDYEMLLWQVLGMKRGYQKASQIRNISDFKKNINKVIEYYKKRIKTIDADERLKEMLFSELNLLQTKIKKIKKNSDKVELFIDAMMIISRLLGYDWVNGCIYRTPIYVTGLKTIVTNETKLSGKNYHTELYEKEKNLIKERKKIIKKLKDEGFKTPEIAYMLDTSDYAIKKIIFDIEKASRKIK